MAALLLGGAVGKSAQLPLQTWLPDAMAGPTPVSALIHAATMVTAGVYLIARTHTLFTLAPPVMFAVAVIGAATLLVAGFSALVQRDIKRVLAYSTISQLGYMFLALGVGAFSAAVFHLMTHAFFKALLFLGAGAVILALHHEQDMGKMGGLAARAADRLLDVPRRQRRARGLAAGDRRLLLQGPHPVARVVVAGLRQGAVGWPASWARSSPRSTSSGSSSWCSSASRRDPRPRHTSTWKVHLPLIVLAVLSIGGGWVELPPLLGDQPRFSRFLDGVFAEHGGAAAPNTPRPAATPSTPARPRTTRVTRS